MFVKKISALPDLVLAHGATSFDVAACLGQILLESTHPIRIVLVQRLVGLVQVEK